MIKFIRFLTGKSKYTRLTEGVERDSVNRTSQSNRSIGSTNATTSIRTNKYADSCKENEDIWSPNDSLQEVAEDEAVPQDNRVDSSKSAERTRRIGMVHHFDAKTTSQLYNHYCWIQSMKAAGMF